MNWINALFYQVAWIVTVGGAGHGWWWCGPLAFAVFAGWQLTISVTRLADVRLVLSAAVLGFVVDSVFIQCGFLHYAAALPWQGLAPVWIVTLWMSFALTLNHSLAALQRYPLAAALIGALGAPLAYLAAARAWNSVIFFEPQRNGVIAIGIAWMLVTPLLLVLARHLRTYKPLPAGIVSTGAH